MSLKWTQVIFRVHMMAMVLSNAFRKPINRNKCTPYQLYTHLNLYDDTTTFPCTKNWFNIHEENQTSSCGFQVYKGEFFWLYQKTTNANPFLQTLFLPNISTLSATKTKLSYSYYTFEIFWFRNLLFCHLFTFTSLRPGLVTQTVYIFRISMSQ